MTKTTPGLRERAWPAAERIRADQRRARREARARIEAAKDIGGG